MIGGASLRRLVRHARAWHAAQSWHQVDQVTHARRVVLDDWAGMAHNTVARELTERYLALLAPDWQRRPHEPLDTFRRRLGLEPRGARPFDSGEK